MIKRYYVVIPSQNSLKVLWHWRVMKSHDEEFQLLFYCILYCKYVLKCRTVWGHWDIFGFKGPSKFSVGDRTGLALSLPSRTLCDNTPDAPFHLYEVFQKKYEKIIILTYVPTLLLLGWFHPSCKKSCSSLTDHWECLQNWTNPLWPPC